jgi:hypothetical protein
MPAETTEPPRAGEIASPASYIQRSMWAVAQRHRDAPLNVMILPWRVRGEIDVSALRLALTDLLMRHRTLRSRLVALGGKLLQIVAPEVPLVLRMEIAQGDDEESRWRAVVTKLRQRGRESMDLTSGAVFETWLVGLSPTDHVLCFFVHHAMCDGWSSLVLINDLVALYDARVQGRVAVLPPIDEQYSDFASAQIATYEAGGYVEQIAYWRDELADPPRMPLALPTSAPRKGNRDWMARSPVLHAPGPTLAVLRQVARTHRVSMFSVLLAALATLLYYRTGAEDQIIGVPILGRWSASAMRFVGCATNMLPARIRLDGTMAFFELASQVHATVRRLLAYGRVPLELILRETQGPVVGSLPFPVWCQYRESAPAVGQQSTGLSLTPFVIERGTLLTELDVDMQGGSEGLQCEFAYRPSLFDGGMVDALMHEYGLLLALLAPGQALTVARLGAALGGRD